MKRFLSIMLTLIMILGMMPIMTNAATDLSVNGGKIDITDKTVGPYTLQYLDVYKQTSFEAVSIVSAVQDGTVIDVVLAEGTDPSEALQAGFGGSGQSGAMLQQSGNKCTLVNGSGTMNLSYAVRIGPQTYGQGSYTVNFTTAGLSSGGESGSEDEEGGEEPSTGTELTVDNEAQYTTVDIIDQPLGSGNVTTLTIYLQSSFAKVNVDKATQDGNVINLVLAESTDLSAAIQLAVSGSGLGMPQSHSGNKVTLANGKANTEYTYSAGGNSVTYTVNLIVKGAESGEEELPATLDITTDLSEAEVMYTQGKTATALTVKAEQSKGETVTYQWYSNTEKSTEGATSISGETSSNYTPATNEIGTTYYYVVASSGDLIVASKIAKITVEAPVVKITTNLSENEVKYTLGKSAAALNITAEYTGVTENAVAYQWYSYTDSAENAVAISGATEASYTPSTDAIGTTYYYAGATCEGAKATSNVAKITIEAPVVKFTTDLNESEVKYTEGKTATALTVKAEYTGITEDAVTYQWYSYTDNPENAVAILGATEVNYTPATDAIGTTYYYAVATCEDIKATSKVAKITIEAPVVKFTTNLNESEVKYTEGKTATALTVKAEYTGVTEDAVTYQWYSYTDSVENAVAILGATEANYTPATGALGTTYYYAVATHGELTLASKIAKITVETLPLLPVENNVIDIKDTQVAYRKNVYSATAVNIKIIGADVEKATEEGTTVNIVLDGITEPDAEISFEFGTVLSSATISGNTGTVKLDNGKATQSVTLTGAYSRISSWKGSVTYTLNFSLGTPPAIPPERIQETDSTSTYGGVAVEINLKDYFKLAKTYYLVEGEEKKSIDGSTYTFREFTGGTHTLIFAASNDNGYCPDYVTVTVEVTEMKSSAWLDIKTSNGSVNTVKFTDADGNEIEGLTAYLDGTTIKVSVPRTYAANGKITATFDLTQSGGLPFITTSNQATGNSTAKNNKFTEKTTTLSSGSATFTFYLYNSNPSAVNNSYTTYSIAYSIANELPVLAEGQDSVATSSMTADKTYTLDLDGMFIDPDEDDTITGWMVSVDGKEPVDAVVDENNVYTYQTNDAGEHTLVFYGKDNYNTISKEKYTVTLTVDNSSVTYDVTATIRGTDSTPTFYYSADAKEGTELQATSQGSVYTVKVPTNISMISWRADGIGMNAPVSEENNNIILIKPVFIVKADDTIDEKATVTVAHSTLNVAGSENNYLLLGGEKYTFTATPSADYEEKWKEGKLEGYTVSTNVVEINLVTKGTVFTFPYFAFLTVSEAATNQGIAPVKLEPVKTTDPDYASGTKTATYELKDGKVYEYRVSVPDDNVNCDQYVTYAAVFTKNSSEGITITKDQIESGDKGRTTLDRNVASNRGRNVADLYTNVNSKGYKKLSIGDEFKLVATRNYRGINADWLLNLPYYYVEPEFHYTVVDDNGNIKAVGEGTAIVMITYDAMTVNFESKLSEGALGDYGATPNDFFGAIWPENTGVFVISVGSGDSNITTGMTINEDKATGQKLAGKNIDAELDVIYFVGEKGEYTFTPAIDGVSVFVANPVVSDKMSFTGFIKVSANEDGSVTVPLTAGRNIVKLVKDDKVEYQVITAKSTNIKINGEPLDTAAVTPGQKVKVEFDNVFAPVFRMMVYNTASAIVYSDVSGWEGKFAGNARGSMGEYTFAGYAPKRIVEHFVSVSADGSGYSNSQVTTAGELTVPEDFNGEYFTLSGGAFNIGGFMPYLLGSHYEKLGTLPPSNTTNNNVNCYLGRMPDISIPVGEVTGISATTPTKTTYNIGDVFDPAGMEVTVNFKMADGSTPSKVVTAYTYDNTPFTEAGEKKITIFYGEKTAEITVTVTDVTLDKLEVTSAPSKTLYYIGDTFNPTGMVITAVYSDGSTREITDYTYAPDTVSKDTTAITVTYGSKSVDVPVTVSLVERLEITKQPTKVTYTVGERFEPAGMEVTAYYSDGSGLKTEDYNWSPSGQLTTDDTTITVTYTGNEGVADPESATIAITVEENQGGSGDISGGDTPSQNDSIKVYMTFVNRGKIVVQDEKIEVYDENKDGKYSIGDAFRALHREHYSGGESGYKEISGNGLSGWVSKFWGSSDSTFTYALNHSWAKSTQDSIRNGDKIAAINGLDDVFYSDLFTWFEKSSYSAKPDTDVELKVNGLNLMASNATYNALHAPYGATVTVYDQSGNELKDMSTTVAKGGTFTLKFAQSGTYTVKVSGEASWGSYSDAPVAPSTCKVSVSSGGGSVSGGDKTDSENDDKEITTTLKPEVTTNSSGEAKVEVNSKDVTNALTQAEKDNADVLEIAPEVKGEASKVEVKLPQESLNKVADSGLGLNVNTPVADVKLPKKAVAELATQKGELSVTASSDKDGKVSIDVSIGGKSADEIDGGLKVTLPDENKGKVMVIVNEDGTETIVTKHITSDGVHQAMLPGSATIKMIDNHKEFTDSKGHWGEDSINFVTERELYQGVGNGKFDTEGTMTRAMLVTVLYRLEGETKANYEHNFTDVADSQWYADSVAWANENNIVKGVADNSFDPDAFVTREQVATILYRYAQYLDMSTHHKGDITQFNDHHEVSDWAKDAKSWAVGAGIIGGKPGNILDSNGNATRTEVAAMIQRLITLMVK